MENLQKHHQEDFITPFGTVLGSFQGVEGRSNGSDHYSSGESNFHNGLYTGGAYQSVEYARRWLQASKGLNFHSFPVATHVWSLTYVERISDNKATEVKSIPNGSNIAPTAESMLIWKNTPEYFSGHIAIITEVSVENKYIRIAEQNISNNYWPGDYAKEIPLEIIDGQYWIRDDHEIAGWIVINFDVDSQNEDELHHQPSVSRVVQPWNSTGERWIDYPGYGYKAFEEYWEEVPFGKPDKNIVYYTFQSHLANKIKYAAMELNWLCLVATDHVIKSDELLRKFKLPEWTWERIRSSWKGPWESGSKTLCGRFDFGINGRSLKMFEFNADSAGSLVESGAITDKWASTVGCTIGKSAGADIESLLINQAKEIFQGFVHIMIDNENEEICCAAYMKEVFIKAGFGCKVIMCLEFTKDENGRFFDNDGIEIKNVWKMWNWDTIINDFEKPRNENNVKISDILLNPEIVVYEPIWKAVTSNKALLPILSELCKGHPYLLETEWQLEGSFEGKSYVRKPIIGRCGESVEIFNRSGEKLDKIVGRFEDREFIYQEVFEMPKFDGFSPTIGAWVIGMIPGGFEIREAETLIAEFESPVRQCRIIE